METELELVRTLKAMIALIERARSVAEPVLRRWDAEEQCQEQQEAA